MFNYLNIELTNRCNKRCPFCGHRAHVKECGEMDIDLFDGIVYGIDGLEIVQFHRDGEPLLYPELGHVFDTCSTKGVISNVVTNGKILTKKENELKDCTTVTVSVYEKDKEQYDQIKTFKHQDKLLIKILGDYVGEEYDGYNITRRQIHKPSHSLGYRKPPLKPEIGVCLDILKPSVDWRGNMYICNRNDPEKRGLLGNLGKESIYEIWYGDKRQDWVKKHMNGMRHEVPLCAECEYWGIPTA